MIYLASPYTHKDPFVREARYLAAAKVVAQYLKDGKFVYSPIVHCHELAKIVALGMDFEFWKTYNYHMLELASELHVLGIDGWADSDGVSGEISHWGCLKPGNKWQMVKP